jgi:hypothetical protein
LTLHSLSQIADVTKRRDTPKSLTQQGKFKTYPVAMSGVLDSDGGWAGVAGAAGLAAFLDAVAIVADAFECPWAGAVTAFGDHSTDTEIGSKSVRSAMVYRFRRCAMADT